MRKYNCLIIEDEPHAAKVLKDYISQVPFLELRSVCSDAICAMEMLQKEIIDVIFLEIHLPKLKGFDFIRIIPHPPQIIITSAYGEYALQSYELNVTDYLLKPIAFSRFLMAVNKLKQHNVNLHVAGVKVTSGITAEDAERPHLFVKVSKKKVKVYIDDILYIESLKEYVRITTKNKVILTKIQLSEVQELLSKNHFIRVHRSFIVARSKIDAFSATEVEIDGKHIPIGRSYKEFVLNLLDENT